MNRTSIRKTHFVIPVLALLAGTPRTAHASEVERVRGHLDGALELLAAADVTHLGDAQRATVHELADEPGLAEWLETNGLTLEEAARIQPWYWSGTVTACTSEQRVPASGCSAIPVTGGVTSILISLCVLRGRRRR